MWKEQSIACALCWAASALVLSLLGCSGAPFTSDESPTLTPTMSSSTSPTKADSTTNSGLNPSPKKRAMRAEQPEPSPMPWDSGSVAMTAPTSRDSGVGSIDAAVTEMPRTDVPECLQRALEHCCTQLHPGSYLSCQRRDRGCKCVGSFNGYGTLQSMCSPTPTTPLSIPCEAP